MYIVLIKVVKSYSINVCSKIISLKKNNMCMCVIEIIRYDNVIDLI